MVVFEGDEKQQCEVLNDPDNQSKYVEDHVSHFLKSVSTFSSLLSIIDFVFSWYMLVDSHIRQYISLTYSSSTKGVSECAQ